MMPVVAPDPAASTMETAPAPTSVPSFPPVPSAPSFPSIPPPEDAAAAEPAVLPAQLAFLEPRLPPLVRSALRDAQVLRLALVVSGLVLVLLLLLVVLLIVAIVR